MKTPKVAFLYLNAFSTTGGLEKFNRAFCKALSDLSIEENIDAAIFSAYDDLQNFDFIDSRVKYKGFKKNKIVFNLYVWWYLIKYKTIFFGHINLAITGLFFKLIFPSKKLIIITHGIEVWGKNDIPWHKKLFLYRANEIFAVSNFTKNKLIEKYGIKDEKIKIFYNTLDPFFKIPSIINSKKPNYLLDRYGLNSSNKILLTISRYNIIENFKGYDLVLEALSDLKADFPEMKYIMGGKYDLQEKERLDKIINKLEIKDLVIFTGFLPDREITDHYLLTDVYVMPSKKEGFGIVFIEAAACGVKVIAGNKDGSVDALMNGELGTLIDPDDKAEITKAIKNNFLVEGDSFLKNKIQLKVIRKFSFDTYKKRLYSFIS